ncbi:ATP-binding protein [Psychrobium sp. MM17-31]|uniref:ATP-binding protein n=1 Tax=Psychrobium sp. MM17-31 TaxID=2917758 RepID=UPI001EF51144|nr:ATP-binding protein [Psychrobium sp. MM17-31]MCG7533148.1 ATP-binding protein [Psychrobium sp. MM17-31]
MASFLMLVFFSITGAILDSAFSNAAKTAAQEKMQLQILSLISSAEQQGRNLVIPNYQSDPQFNEASSGLYGYVLDRAGKELWRSRSAVLISPRTARPTLPGKQTFGVDDTNPNTELFVATYGTIEESQGKDYQYTFVVMQDNHSYRQSIISYRESLWLWLTVVALLLLATQHLLLSRGLRPLHDLAHHLKEIENGDAQSLSGNYPQELSRLTGNLNRLIDSERQQRERYHQRLGDLAHSLKTPLAVISNAASEPTDELRDIVKEQSSRMDQIVRYQLQRAVVSQQVTSITKVNILEQAKQIKSALDKVYKAKAVMCDIRIPQASVFQGDQGDLLEMLGNFMDNAYKYGAGEVRVTVEDNNESISFIVEDNGVGIDESQREEITRRGARLDTQEHGQGIGMAVVVDIVKGYKGTIEISDSDLLGAKFTATFPKHHY